MAAELLATTLRRFTDDAAAFGASVQGPVLLFEAPPDPAKRPSTHQLHAIPKSGYETPYLGPYASVQPLPSTGRFTIGRAPDCDLVLDHGSISRLHAWFERKGTSWLVADAGSRNGTVLNGRRLAGKKLTAVESPGTLGFGDLAAQFFTAERFLEFLRSFRTDGA